MQYPGTILIVDDQEQIRSLMKQRLELKGFDVITAENGLVAYKILENRSDEISGILSDIRMPVMRGTELYEKIISNYPQVKFVMMTGYFDEITDKEQFQNVVIIKKPILGDDLIKICDELQQK